MNPAQPRGLYLPAAVLALPEDVSWPARLVLSEIINLYKPGAAVWVEDDYFVERFAGLSKRTVQQALTDLVKAGLVERDTIQNRKPKRYLTPVIGAQPNADSALGTDENLPQNMREPNADSAVDAPDLAQNLREPNAESALLYKEESIKESSNNDAAPAAEHVKKSASKNDVENDVSFEQFWDAYGKKVDRVKSAKLWAKLGPTTRRLAFAQVPAYVAQWPVPQYRKNPLTWLNGECWNDEGVITFPSAPAGHSPAAAPTPRPVIGPDLDPDAIAEKQRRENEAMQRRIAERQQRQAATAAA